ncbi:MAG TPA: hypothetical protein PKB09_04150 [Candidatus Saccharibacteria bacterium]|nr:hypothetical protein [Candidatus Saccharibacteria bacterium]
MKLDNSQIPVLLSKLRETIKPYIGFAFVVVILGMYGLVIWQIRSYVTQEPSEIIIAEKLNSINVPKIDEDAIRRITQLEDSNVQVKALFENARQNPFTE